MSKRRVLVTGGLGYIGSHAVVELCESGLVPIVVDNLSNSREDVVKRIEQLTGQVLRYEIADIRDRTKLEAIIEKYNPVEVIHFAALKSVGDSAQKPIEYYDNNIQGTLSLLGAMQAHGLNRIIFSSSATVYGPIDEPAYEDMPVSETTNPYGATKAMCERILHDISRARSDWSIAILRYFNPIGAHPSGLIGEDPNGVPNNLMPYVSRVAAGKLKELKVYGDDYPTPDGTGIRDYIHVRDLAAGHVAALNTLKEGVAIYNLGTGKGASVLELISTFERVTGQKVPYTVAERRQGDLANVIANPAKAHRELKWKTKLSLEDMCRDEWNWQQNNFNGY